MAANAARLGSDALVAACRRRADGEWPIRWASWGGRQHLKLVGGDDVVDSVVLGLVGPRPVVVSGCFDGTVRIWDAVSGARLGALALDSGVMSVALGRVADHDLIVAGDEEGWIRVWNATDLKPIGVPLAGHYGAVNTVAFGRVGDRDVIVSGGGDGAVRVWDAATREPLGAPLAPHDGAVNAVAFGRVGDREVIVSGAEDSTIRIWDPVTHRQIGSPFIGHDGAVRTVVIGRVAGRDVIVTNAYKLRRLAGSASAGGVRVWDAATRPAHHGLTTGPDRGPHQATTHCQAPATQQRDSTPGGLPRPGAGRRPAAQTDHVRCPAPAAAKTGDIAYYAPWGNLALFYQDGPAASTDLLVLGHLDVDADQLGRATRITLEAAS
ncbi:hypothetical protein ACVWZD_005040 [Streptomyces sp. TE3672]